MSKPIQSHINQNVSITSMAFGRDMRAVPRRMEVDGVSYDFIGAGRRTSIRSDGWLAEILTMSDGFRNFRLRHDTRAGNWTLLSVG